MKKEMIIACLLVFSMNAMAQSQAAKTSSPEIRPTNVDPVPYSNTISAADLKTHLNILASDEYEGRETGTEGMRKAADYIANHFKKLGLPAVGENGSYFQPITFTWSRWKRGLGIEVDGEHFKHPWDFVSYPVKNQDMPLLETKNVVFLGYGIEDKNYSDYKGRNVKGKVLLVYKGEPRNQEGISYLTGSAEESDWSKNWEKKAELAHQKGAKAILIIDNEIKKIVAEDQHLLLGRQVSLGKKNEMVNSCIISTKLAKALMGSRFNKVVKARDRIRDKGKSKAVKLKSRIKIKQPLEVRSLIGDNVLGYVEGEDPNKKDELLVVTAHYDHLGKRGDDIYNGADDNGSGTSTVLEVAEAFAEAKKKGAGPKRSVLFMLVTGEEKGLLGSYYYTQKPLFPLKNTIANVNVDMVGRVDKKYQDNPNYIYVIGSDRLSTELHEINETANESYVNLTLDYTYNAEDDPNRYYYRSDHYNFAEKGIPAIFYFNGTHEDYHRASDTVDKINFEKMELIAKLIFHTSWELANRDKRIEVDVK